MKLLDDLDGLVSNEVEVIKTIFSIFKLEARLAGLSVMPLLLNILLLFIGLFSFLGTTMVLVGYTINYFLNSPIISISLVLLLNILLMGALVWYLMFNLKKMSFEKTRKFFSNLESGHDHGKKSEHHKEIRNDGRDIALSPNEDPQV